MVYYSINIFKDMKENLLIVPLAFDENGIRRDTNKFVILEKPYTYSMIGEKVIKSFEEIIKEPFQSAKSAVKAHELATGIKSYKKFSKDRLMITVGYNQQTGYVFTPTRRYPDGSYGLDKGDDIEFRANVGTSPEEIGSLVMKAFEAVNLLK